MRARLTILGFNLAVTTFQIGNTRILGGRSHPETLSVIRTGMTIAGSIAWVLAIYVGPVVSLVRYPHKKLTKLIHVVAYFGILVCISQLWWAAQRLEGRTAVEDGSLSSWLNALAAPLFW
jgi:hypothetical protein